MPLSLATVGAKITASFINAIVSRVNRQGLTSIIPTTVTGAGVTLGSTGTVTFAAVTSGSINGCFTSEFDNYRIECNFTSASSDLRIRLRAAGTDATGGADYGTQVVAAASGTVSSAVYGVGFSYLSTAVLTGHWGSVDMFAPAIAGPTRWTGLFSGPVSLTSSGGNHVLSVSYDGITIYPAAGTLSGTIRIYGYNN